MKLRRKFLEAFLVAATVETLGIVMVAHPARTEPLNLGRENQLNTPEAISAASPEPLPTPTMAPVTGEKAQTSPAVGGEKTSSPQLTPSSSLTQESKGAEEQSSPLQPGTLTSQTQSASTPLATGEVRILTPTPGTVLDIPAATVILQFTEGSEVKLQVNGVAVDPSLIGRTETDKTTKLVTQTWYGVALQEGENTITAQATTNGVTSSPSFVTAQVRGEPTQLRVETVEARIPADGRSTATIQGQLLDANGNRSNRNGVVTLVTNAGEFVGTDYDRDQVGWQVQARQGQFTATLQSHLKAQTVRIRATAGELEAFTQLQFETSLRPSLMSGVINLRLGQRGTDYYGSFRDFLPADGDNSTQLDFSTSVFATGAIGEWLFTGAYNSDRTLNQSCDGVNRLYQDVQFCDSEALLRSADRNYPVYGDSSTVESTTPSQDSLFLRFERSSRIPNADPDYAMWGDYDTEEFATASQQFTATTRQLHGFKGNYNLGNLQVTAFYGDNVEGFQRDTIPPDGTSGYYFLSQRLLVPGSENVFVELEELTRPGTVLERKQLNRGPDYEIDYDRGTLLFRQPFLRTQVSETGEVLVRRIVVTYQYESEGSDNNIYGGRVRYHLSRELNQESWIGATYLNENQGVRDFELYGADAYISLGSDTHLIAEYAHSSNDSEVLGFVEGSAYRFEAQVKIAQGIQGRAYYRDADSGFANNATVSFVPGQRRYGANVTAQVSPTTNVRVQYDHEDNQGIAPRPLNTFEDLFTSRLEPLPGSVVDNSLTTISAGIEQRIGSARLEVDWLHRDREDRLPNSPLSSNSDQLRSRFTLPLTSNLTFLAQNELTLSSDVDTVYPDRTILGLDWAVLPDVHVRLAQQFYTRGQFEGNAITSLEVAGSHDLSENTAITGRYSILGGANEITNQGAVGLNHTFRLTPGLRLNLAYEYVFGDFVGRTAAGTRFFQPYTVGQSAAVLGFGSGDSYSIGIEYTDDPAFHASARYEHRTSSSGSNTVISASATGKISPALTALFRYNQANSSNQVLRGLGDTANLRFGLAYRDPNKDSFNALVRYEYRKNPSIIPETILEGSGTGSREHLLALELLYAPNWRWEFYGKYAIRNSTSYLAEDLVGTSSLSLAQLRASYRLGYSWDLTGEARWINQPSAGYSETGFLLELGYYLTPNLRLSAGYAFGEVDDRDFSGSRSAGGPYFGLTVKLNGLFDGFGHQEIAPPQEQESRVEPVANQSAEKNL
ncbi:MAG: TonB-dependent receptor [Symplocastrum torsivum CPER-KK1]|jgi:hypothetical protein|uniref:TonB-dependent receptor n=1 Tax=Symplocastrum torsivum CPER-KK1 TaxID=450513 RepID=A0A951PIQ2_9CYAN|nr:TonB-dependent receptor [Symplocastrum torsivum CPER-KK1]